MHTRHATFNAKQLKYSRAVVDNKCRRKQLPLCYSSPSPLDSLCCRSAPCLPPSFLPRNCLALSLLFAVSAAWQTNKQQKVVGVVAAVVVAAAAVSALVVVVAAKTITCWGGTIENKPIFDWATRDNSAMISFRGVPKSFRQTKSRANCKLNKYFSLFSPTVRQQQQIKHTPSAPIEEFRSHLVKIER